VDDRGGGGSFGAGVQGGRVFPSEGSPVNLAKEDWVFRRYLDMDPLWAAEEKPAEIPT